MQKLGYQLGELGAMIAYTRAVFHSLTEGRAQLASSSARLELAAQSFTVRRRAAGPNDFLQNPNSSRIANRGSRMRRGSTLERGRKVRRQISSLRDTL